jgi:murein L,D-transpeptidase YafK
MKYLLFLFYLVSVNVFAYLPIDEVKVYKSKHRMDLLFQTKIIKSYKVMLGSGGSGAKIQKDDRLVPEGKYFLDEKNPNSKYHRSIHITYPNEDDIKRAQDLGVDPGGEIFIHGLPNTKSSFVKWIRNVGVKIKDKTNSRIILKKLDWTKGCVAVSDQEIEEIFDNMPLPTPITIYP